MSGTGNSLKTISLSGDPIIDGLLTGHAWGDSQINYSFALTSSAYNYAGTGLEDLPNNFSTVSAAQIDAVHFALNSGQGPDASDGFSIEGFTNQNIWGLGGSDSTTAEIRFGQTSSSTVGTARVADFPGNYVTSPVADDGDVWFGTGNDYRSPEAGNYSWHTHLHEIGHAMGLSHGHSTWYYSALPSQYDSMEYSIMTYRSYEGDPVDGIYSNEEWGYAQTYMIADIAALQYMYGADYTTNSGDTVYSWSPTSGDTLVNGAVGIDAGGNRIFATIWDGGGTDTYDLSAYSSNLTLDLTPGGHSYFSSAQIAYLGDGNYSRGNIFNALQYNGDARSLIENAIGGTGDDDITGNAAVNQLWGGRGIDTLHGEGGDDFLYGGHNNDFLYGGTGDDYLRGNGGHDRLFGNADNDRLIGDAGNDLLNGGGGNDRLYGNNNNDRLYGGTGNDYLRGNNGNDRFYGGGGSDRLFGDAGSDLLNGYAGHDKLYGGANNDRLYGGSHNDRLDGGTGNDRLYGGTGNDLFVFTNGFGDDTIFDFSANNNEDIDLSGVSGITSFTDLVNNHLSDVGGVATITAGSDTITLVGYTSADFGSGLAISSDDFLF